MPLSQHGCQPRALPTGVGTPYTRKVEKANLSAHSIRVLCTVATGSKATLGGMLVTAIKRHGAAVAFLGRTRGKPSVAQVKKPPVRHGECPPCEESPASGRSSAKKRIRFWLLEHGEQRVG